MTRIPRKIHYCWLSGEPFPDDIQGYFESWQRHLHDYEFVLWDMDRLERTGSVFALEAADQRKWAFAADYVRLYALHHEGGVYLDSDVEVFRTLDPFLDHELFSGVAHWASHNAIGIEAAVMGSVPGHPWIRDCLDLYDQRRFVNEDGSLDETIIGGLIADIAEEKYGFRRVREGQSLGAGIELYPQVYFTHPWGEYDPEVTVCVHHCVGSWRDENPSSRRLDHRIRRALRRMVGTI